MLPAVLNAREKVFRPQWEFSFQERSRRQPVAFAQGRGGGILVSNLKKLSLCRLCGPLCLGALCVTSCIEIRLRHRRAVFIRVHLWQIYPLTPQPSPHSPDSPA